jgi:carbonic anhydrase
MLISRRAMLGGSALIAAGTLPTGTWAQERKKLTPAQARARLAEGNRKHAAGEPEPAALRRAPDQEPYATIVCCSDSRASPELIFQAGSGELFVVRNAGNTAATTQSLGTIEYSVWKIEVPLIVVLGHSQCGAVEAAAAVVQSNATFPGSIGPLVEPVLPAAIATRGRPVDDSIRENVVRVRNRLRSPEQPILYPAIRAGELEVIGAIYNLDSGRVEWLAD